MNIKAHTTPEKLEDYSFMWSQARLVIAAVALFMGGTPPIYFFLRTYELVTPILNLAWIISGLAAFYLLYTWNKHRTLFGRKENLDLYAFLVMTISGINLGLTGILRTNLGMSISSNSFVFLVVGVLYVVSAYHLQKRYNKNGGKLFS